VTGDLSGDKNFLLKNFYAAIVELTRSRPPRASGAERVDRVGTRGEETLVARAGSSP
jgi:hypothetical protein